MPVSEDKVAKAAAHYRKLLDRLPGSPESLSQAPNSELKVIVGRAGAERRTPQLLARLEVAFAEAGIVTFPRLTDPFLKSTDRVCMLDAKRPLEGLAEQRFLFQAEKDLQNFLWTRREHIDEFRKRGLSGFQQQAVLDGGRRIDILCKRTASSQLVGIELKVAQPDDRSAGQIQQYLRALARHAKNRGFASAHLIVVSGQPDKSVRDLAERHAEASGATIEFLLYRVQTKLVPHP
jgi:hypothetical protein